MPDRYPSIEERIQQGVKQHEESLRQKGIEERRLQEQQAQQQTEKLEFQAMVGRSLVQTMRNDAHETARMLTKHGIVPDSEVETPGGAVVGYEFMFPSLAKFGVRKWKPVTKPTTTKPAWLIVTKKIFKLEDHFFKGEYGTSRDLVSHTGVGMDAQGELIDIKVNLIGRLVLGTDSRGHIYQTRAHLIDKGPLGDESLIPHEQIVVDKALEDQPALNQWRQQLESLGVAMMTSQPYEPLELTKDIR